MALRMRRSANNTRFRQGLRGFRPAAGPFLMVMAIATSAGCLSERSFPFSDTKLIQVKNNGESGRPANNRAWLEATHNRLRALVPESGYEPLLTNDLIAADGRAVDVFAHFDKDPAYLHTAIGNMSGLVHTAQVTGSTEAVETPAPEWPGFEDVWIEVQPGVSVSARLGLAMKDGVPIESDCIVLLPGLLGDNIRLRTRDICAGLRDAGFHTLALEFRGHGQAEARFPETLYNFGALETSDMMVVAEWLQDKPYIARTGIVGFSWSANIALLSAWEDGRPSDDPMVAPRLAECQSRYDRTRRHYEAGIFAISPTLDFEKIMDRLETPHSFNENPVLSAIQDTVARRIARKNHGPKTGSLRKLIEYEFSKSALGYPGGVVDGVNYLRLSPYKDEPYEPKLMSARVPVLIIHGANDPLAYAQEVANFIADTPNPNVACVILHGGGHDGFAAYCGDYLYSLMINFFDANHGPKPVRTTLAQLSSVGATRSHFEAGSR